MGEATEDIRFERVAAVRRFNRFYTRRIGVLNEGLLRSKYSLTEVRVLYELAHEGHGATATTLNRELGLDPGYLSRLLRGFARRGLIRKESSTADRRRTHLSLTKRGRETFAALNRLADEEIDAMLGALPDTAQRRLMAALSDTERLLDAPADVPAAPYIVRPPRTGDLGWVVHRHGALYAHEYGWDERFEALVAGIVSDFVRDYDATRERCWIAERGGEIVGSVFLVRGSETIAKLRLLYVEPAARGLGIGRRLVDECVRFAREAGYRTITLWTQSILTSARRIYEGAGFRLVRSEPHASFGFPLVAETWELDLGGGGARNRGNRRRTAR